MNKHGQWIKQNIKFCCVDAVLKKMIGVGLKGQILCLGSSKFASMHIYFNLKEAVEFQPTI